MPQRTWKGSDLEDPARATAWLNELGLAAFAGVPGSPAPAKFPRPLITWLDECIAASSWTKSGAGSTATDDADSPLFATAIKYVSDGAGTGVSLTKTLGAAVDLSAQNLIVALKVDDFTHYSSLQIRVGSGGDTATNYAYIQPAYTSATQRWVTAGQWVLITIPLGPQIPGGGSPGQWITVGTGPTWSAINAIKLRLADDAAGQLTARFGGVGYFPQPAKHVISLTFDDSRKTHATVAAPYMAQYGFAGTSFTIVEGIDVDPSSYMTSQQIKNLRDFYHWDIGSHAFSNVSGAQAHSLGYDAILSASAETDMLQLKNWLRSYGMNGLDILALPHGSFDIGGVNPNVLDQVRRYFNAALVTYANTIETYPPANPAKLRRYVWSSTGGDTAATIKTAIDNAMTNKQWLIFDIHNLVAVPAGSSDVSISDFQSVIDYLHTQGANVKTVGEVLSGGV